MPYVNIQVTDEHVSDDEKARLIKGVTDLLEEVLNKPPSATFVVIDEVSLKNWGIAGLPVDEYRARQDALSE